MPYSVVNAEGREIKLSSTPEDQFVTKKNVAWYIFQVSNYKLNTELRAQTNAFLSGLGKVLPISWLSMFNAAELQELVCGTMKPVSIEDLKNNTVYSVYDESSPTIKAFWEVLEEMSEEDKAKFLLFVTSSSRPPLQGFKQLNPKFSIRHAGNEIYRLPSASTCVNLLKLPNYQSKELLRERLMYAIQSAKGFDLS
ncbi:hypothetical protein CANCADRAFT_29700 [Tortispora caseinolytica NRRL Y-17796]|uniref:HECT-type E3 ubiquitin transferase n=1 Tax=Tortispora caseinolytica NRRL Y-17796 TaxID=767744 RepID=A0A1E4T9N4_9ASCO|nr:hypothetical protein CANCADRAFT_29700 [Tortispora caseinolytica NRRL Y-17796]